MVLVSYVTAGRMCSLDTGNDALWERWEEEADQDDV